MNIKRLTTLLLVLVATAALAAGCALQSGSNTPGSSGLVSALPQTPTVKPSETPSDLLFEQDTVECFCNVKHGAEGFAVQMDKTGSHLVVTAVCKKNFDKLEIPAEYKGIPIKEIGSRAFAQSNIYEIVLPDSIGYIGTCAFADSAQLSKVRLPEGLMALNADTFENCERLERIDLPQSLVSIGSKVFYGSGLESITIPDSVTLMGMYVFAECSNLESVKLSSACYSTGESTFWKCVSLESIEIPEGVREIGLKTFDGCNNLKNIALPSSLISIKKAAFTGCLGLTNVNLPNKLKNIYERAFADCWNLKSVSIPESLLLIDKEAFANCSALSGIILSDKIKTIGAYAFRNCRSIKELHIPSSVSTINENAFVGCDQIQKLTVGDGAKLGLYSFSGCEALVEVEFLGKSELGKGCFRHCTALQKVTLPKGIEIIPEYTFEGCSSLEVLLNFDSVTRVETSSFNGCSSLVNIENSEALKRISGGAFANCVSLHEDFLNSKKNTLEYVGGGAFEGCTSFENIDITYPIGGAPFTKCTNLKKLTIKDGIEIGYGFFNGCTSLEEVDISKCVLKGDTDWMFLGCTSLKNVILPDGLRYIKTGFFQDCTSLEEVEIPESVEYISSYVFYNCTSLKRIYINGYVKIESMAFDAATINRFEKYDNAYYIGSRENPYMMLIRPIDDKITSCILHPDTLYISEWGLGGCSKLKNVQINNKLKKLGTAAFSDCRLLEEIILPETVDEIGEFCFTRCGSLKTVVINGDVPEIKMATFEDCPRLSTLILTDATRYVDERAFNNCDMLLQEYGNGVYAGPLTDPYRFLVDTVNNHIEELFLHESTICIAPNAVYSRPLKRVVLNEGLEVMGALAFENSESISFIKFPSTLKRLEAYAFLGCTVSNDIMLPKSLEFLGQKSLDCDRVKYEGTVEDWFNIPTNYFNKVTRVVCSDGTLVYRNNQYEVEQMNESE